MGAWGAGLYQDDVALDLKNTIALLAKMPVSGDRILEILLETHNEGVELTDDGGPTFWLVVADQFERRGIASRAAFKRALTAITSGADLRDQKEHDMDPTDLRKRSKMLDELAGRLRSPRPLRPRPTTRNPPPYVVEVGEVYSFPTMQRASFNAWFSNWEQEGFVPDGWGAMIVLARGRVFDWLPWCAFASVTVNPACVPTVDDVARARLLNADGASLCVPRSSHLKKMGMQLIGQLAVNPKQAAALVRTAKREMHETPELAVTAGWSFTGGARSWRQDASDANGKGVRVAELLAKT